LWRCFRCPINALQIRTVEDQFDRIIVAQALHEPLRLITHDPIVKSYSDAILLV